MLPSRFSYKPKFFLLCSTVVIPEPTAALMVQQVAVEQMTTSLKPYLHQEDLVLLGGGGELFHLSGVHGERFLTQHVLSRVEEQQSNSPVLRVQHSQVHNVCKATDVPTSNTKTPLSLPVQGGCPVQ